MWLAVTSLGYTSPAFGNKLIALLYQEGLLTCWQQVWIPSLYQTWNNIPSSMKSRVRHTQSGLKTDQFPVLYMALFWSCCMDTKERRGEKKYYCNKLEISLQSSCLLYWGTRQILNTSTAIITPAWKWIRTSFVFWQGFSGLIFGRFSFDSLVFCLWFVWAFLNVCLVTGLMGREKLPVNGFMICHSWSRQEKEYVVSFNISFWTELVLKYWANFPLQYLAA